MTIWDLLLVGGPLVLIAVIGLIKWLGPKWIDHRLSLQLERFKAEQQGEVEKLRQFLSGRISRIHEKEFEILPQAWLLLHTAHGAIHRCTFALKQYPDFGRLPEARFEEFLADCPLSGAQKEELRQAPDRRKYYSEAISWVDLEDALSTQRELNNFLIQHRIFMTKELREKFGAVNTDLASAVSDYETWKGLPSEHELLKSSREKVSSLDEKIRLVEEAVQERLHYGEA